MATEEQALAAKEKFKEEFWKKDPNKYNIIGIGVEVTFDEEGDDVLDELYFVRVYLFNVKDAEGFPATIDEVEIKYLPVINEPKQT